MLVLLCVLCAPPVAAQDPNDPRIAEIHRWVGEASRHDLAGRLPEAIAALDKALTVLGQLTGRVSEDYVETLAKRAALREALGDLDRARRTLEEVLSIRKELNGADHWATGDARRSLADLTRRANMTPEKRAQLERERALEARAHALHRAGRAREAIPLAKRIVEIRRAVWGEAHVRYANSLSNLALQYKKMGEFAKAERLFIQAREIDRRVVGESHPGHATNLANLASLYELNWEYAKAEALYIKAEEIRKKALGEGHPAYARLLSSLAGLYVRMGKLAKAEPLAYRALEIQKRTMGESHPEYAGSLNFVAALHRMTGQYARAETLLRQASEIMKKALPGHPNCAAMLKSLASLHMSMGEYSLAEPLLREAMGIVRDALGEATGEYAAYLNGLGALYLKTGAYAKAEPILRRSVDIAKRAYGESHAEYAYSLGSLADMHNLMGQYATAERLRLRVSEIVKKALGAAHWEYAAALHNLAAGIKDAARAESVFRQALDVARAARGEAHPKYAVYLASLGGHYMKTGEYRKAEPLLRQARAITSKSVGESLQHAGVLQRIANLHRVKREWVEAETLLLRALEIRRPLGESHPGYALNLQNLAAVYHAAGEFGKALPRQDAALSMRRSLLDATFAVQSEHEQFQMSQRFRGSLDLYLSLAVATQRDAAKAYSHALAWKGAIFARQSQLRMMAADPGTADLFREYERTTRRLATRQMSTPTPKQRKARARRIGELTEQREKLGRELSKQSEAYRRARAMTAMNASGVQKMLPAGVVLLDFLEYDRWYELRSKKHLVAFVVPRTGAIRLIDLGLVAPIAEQIDAWRRGVRGAGYAKPGERLRSLVWEPLVKHLSGVTTVLVSPDGVLARMPLGALPGKRPGSFLMEELAIAVVPVPRLLPDILERRATPNSTRSLLLLGDVDYGGTPAAATTGRTAARGSDRSNFRPLANTPREVEAIRKAFVKRYRDGGVRVLMRETATEAEFREHAPQHRWLHLATHGFFAPATVKSALGSSSGADRIVGFHPGLLSGLALAGANLKPDPDRDDGILTALEVAALDLSRVEVAVLSACETGLGELAAGEGVLGLQRAFQVAGARATVTSLWTVPDRATRLLMERFYENVWGKKLGKLEALREAQLWMLKEGRAQAGVERGLEEIEGGEQPQASDRLPPYYWAAFVLSGDWR